MSEFTVIYWRDIPTQIVSGRGRRARKHQLSDRFMVAVDKAAMASGLAATDGYLAQWRKIPFDTPEENTELSARSIAEQFEREYPTSRLAELVGNGGLAPN